jgi:hypothetical protein
LGSDEFYKTSRKINKEGWYDEKKTGLKVNEIS